MACSVTEEMKKLDKLLFRPDVQIIVVGDSGCGKTKFIERFATRLGNAVEDDNISERAVTYSAEYPTYSVSRRVKIIEIFGVEENLVDLVTEDIRDANAIVFMYAIDDPLGFEALAGKWIQKMEDNGSKANEPSFLVGNKKDLREDQQVIDRLSTDGQAPVTCQQCESLCVDRSLQGFFEISSIDANDPRVADAFRCIVRSAIQHWRTENIPF